MNKKTLTLVVALMVVAFLVPTSSTEAISPNLSQIRALSSYRNMTGNTNYNYEKTREKLNKKGMKISKCQDISTGHSATFPMCKGQKLTESKTGVRVNIVSYNSLYARLYVKGSRGSNIITVRKGLKVNFRLAHDSDRYITVMYEGIDIADRALINLKIK
jgi:hypothetical protein